MVKMNVKDIPRLNEAVKADPVLEEVICSLRRRSNSKNCFYGEHSLEKCTELIDMDQAFENTSTSVAASQMRNALNDLVSTIKDPSEKEVCVKSY